MSEKPVIFISHSSKDKELADKFKKILEECFQFQIDVFASSNPEAISVGRDWFNEVIQKIESATVLLILVTPTAITRPWIWFETGFYWNFYLNDTQGRMIIPLYTPDVEIPSPLNTLQAKVMNKADEMKVFHRELWRFLHHVHGSSGLMNFGIIGTGQPDFSTIVEFVNLNY